MDQAPDWHPTYHQDFCRVCYEPLGPKDRTLGQVMHTQCEKDWLAQSPHIMCMFCENPLDEDDVAERRTVHLHCEAQLLTSPPNWPLEEATKKELEDKLANDETSCAFCGEPLTLDELALEMTMHEGCQTIWLTDDERILAEDEDNPVMACTFCGKIVDEDEAVFHGTDGPFHQSCFDVNKQLN